MSKKYRPDEFADKIGVSTKTLRRWDASGKLIAKRTASNHRYYDETYIRQLYNIKEEEKKTIVYCRVSSAGQKNDLKSQRQAIERFCLSTGIIVDDWVQEIGGGMNFKRQKFLSLMSSIQAGEVGKLLIAHKDRLCRFGFDYFSFLAKQL